MKTGLSALNHVRGSLLRSRKFTDIAGSRVYYVAATNGTVKPYVTCTRTAIVAQYTKDGWVEDDVVVAIDIVSESYEQAVELAEVVRETIEDSMTEYDSYRVADCKMTRSAEGYSLEADAYVITMDFDIVIT